MEVTLDELEIERPAEIKRIMGGFGFQRRIAALGLRVGKIVRKVASEPLRGPIVVEVDGTRVALGRGMSMKIFVEEIEE
ncbi:MAG: FeoA family protein [Actinomycetota bacterium]